MLIRSLKASLNFIKQNTLVLGIGKRSYRRIRRIWPVRWRLDRSCYFW